MRSRSLRTRDPRRVEQHRNGAGAPLVCDLAQHGQPPRALEFADAVDGRVLPLDEAEHFLQKLWRKKILVRAPTVVPGRLLTGPTDDRLAYTPGRPWIIKPALARDLRAWRAKQFTGRPP